jgi:hypothetical protein
VQDPDHPRDAGGVLVKRVVDGVRSGISSGSILPMSKKGDKRRNDGLDAFVFHELTPAARPARPAASIPNRQN